MAKEIDEELEIALAENERLRQELARAIEAKEWQRLNSQRCSKQCTGPGRGATAAACGGLANKGRFQSRCLTCALTRWHSGQNILAPCGLPFDAVGAKVAAPPIHDGASLRDS